MNISLTPELEKMVQAKVASGHYSNASEVVREALRLLIKQDKPAISYENWLRAEIAIGLAEAERGEMEEFDMREIIDEVLAENAS